MRKSKSKQSARVSRKTDRCSDSAEKKNEPARLNGQQSLLVKVQQLGSGRRKHAELDSVAREEPLEIRVRGQSIAVTMRTPGHDSELAAGFLLSEGLLQHPEDVIEISLCATAASPENVLNVFLAPTVKADLARLTRHVFTSSSCGVCGKASIDEIHRQFPPVAFKGKLSSSMLAVLPRKMRAAQQIFDSTGGLHAAAIFDLGGDLLAVREDVGRHNAVDKVIGWAFLQHRLPLDRHVLLVSGRASFEIIQKALAARIPVVAAVSAPSSLAVELAQESGQTLIGFLRAERMNVYAGTVKH